MHKSTADKLKAAPARQKKAYPDKLFYKIGEVSKIADVEPYVLRYWSSTRRPVGSIHRRRVLFGPFSIWLNAICRLHPGSSCSSGSPSSNIPRFKPPIAPAARTPAVHPGDASLQDPTPIQKPAHRRRGAVLPSTEPTQAHQSSSRVFLVLLVTF